MALPNEWLNQNLGYTGIGGAGWGNGFGAGSGVGYDRDSGAGQAWNNAIANSGPTRTQRYIQGVTPIWQAQPNFGGGTAGTWAKQYGSRFGSQTGLSPGSPAQQAQAMNAGNFYGGGSYGSGGGNPMLGQLFNEMQTEKNRAFNANEQRYNDILTNDPNSYRNRYARTMSNLDKFSGQEREDVNKRYDQNRDKQDQSMISRGLYNTTVLDSARRGVEEDRNAELRRVDDSVLQRRLAYDTGLSKEQLDFMERRQDQYPDQGLMAQIAMEAGKGGVGGSYSYGGSAGPTGTGQGGGGGVAAGAPGAGGGMQYGGSGQSVMVGNGSVGYQLPVVYRNGQAMADWGSGYGNMQYTPLSPGWQNWR